MFIRYTIILSLGLLLPAIPLSAGDFRSISSKSAAVNIPQQDVVIPLPLPAIMLYAKLSNEPDHASITKESSQKKRIYGMAYSCEPDKNNIYGYTQGEAASMNLKLQPEISSIQIDPANPIALKIIYQLKPLGEKADCYLEESVIFGMINKKKVTWYPEDDEPAQNLILEIYAEKCISEKMAELLEEIDKKVGISKPEKM
jgi:hypothetical protein